MAELGVLSGVDALLMLAGLTGGSAVGFEGLGGEAGGFAVSGRTVELLGTSLPRDFRSLAITHQPMSR